MRELKKEGLFGFNPFSIEIKNNNIGQRLPRLLVEVVVTSSCVSLFCVDGLSSKYH